MAEILPATWGAVDVFFVLFAVLAAVSGWRVFRTDSMVRASFLLLTSFLAVGGILLLLAAEYLGFALFFMMAVEMMVMAFFMVMFMMNPAGLNPMDMVHQPKTAAAAGIGSFAVLAWVALAADFPSTEVPPPEDPIATLGHELLGGSMLVFESAGVTLLAAMVGVVILSSRRGRYGDAGEGSRPPGLAPGGEPAGRRPEEGGGHGGHGHGHGHHGHGHPEHGPSDLPPPKISAWQAELREPYWLGGASQARPRPSRHRPAAGPQDLSVPGSFKVRPVLRSRPEGGVSKPCPEALEGYGVVQGLAGTASPGALRLRAEACAAHEHPAHEHHEHEHHEHEHDGHGGHGDRRHGGYG